jgi:hypothetical protein
MLTLSFDSDQVRSAVDHIDDKRHTGDDHHQPAVDTPDGSMNRITAS